MIRAGELRDRVTFQRPVATSDPRWGTTAGWQDHATVWASVRPARAAEPFAGGQVQTDATHEVTVRYRADITGEHRIVYRNRVLEIVGAVDRDGRRRELDITAREQPDEGATHG